MIELLCSRCLHVKNAALFSRSKHARSGYSSWCKPCHAAYHKAWRDTPEGRESKRLSKWRWSHVGRM
jgi:hypothetical protein